MDKTTLQKEEFLQKALLVEKNKTGTTSVLEPWRDAILHSCEQGISMVAILKTLEGEGVKTSYANLSSYIVRQKSFKKKKIKHV